MFQAGSVGSPFTPSVTAQAVGGGLRVFVGLALFAGAAALSEGRRGLNRRKPRARLDTALTGHPDSRRIR